MNWGWKIALVYLSFVILTLAIAIYYVQRDVDLVSEDYYKQELGYQQKIDQASNALEKPVEINYDANSGELTLQFSSEASAKEIQGEIYFYRPSDARMDKKISIKTDSLANQVVNVSTMMPGLWKIKITWEEEGAKYYSEKSLLL